MKEERLYTPVDTQEKDDMPLSQSMESLNAGDNEDCYGDDSKDSKIPENDRLNDNSHAPC